MRGAVTSVIMLIGLQMERDYIRVATVDAATGEKREPNVFTDPTSNAAFLSTQLQSAGYFQLADDEALVRDHRSQRRRLFHRPGDQRLDHHRQLLGSADQPQQRASQAG